MVDYGEPSYRWYNARLGGQRAAKKRFHERIRVQHCYCFEAW